MAKEHEIVKIINAGIKAVLTDAKFSHADLFGISVLVEDNQGNPKPGITDHDGEVTFVGIDDSKPMQLYHRNNGESFKQGEASGDNFQKIHSTSMSLIVSAQRRRIKITPEDLVTLIESGIPAQLTKTDRAALKLAACNITTQYADMNSLSLLRREYKNIKVLDPQVIMFELKYQIECTFSKDCINTLCCKP